MLKSTSTLTWLKKGVVLAYFLGGCSIVATQQEMMEEATMLTQEVIDLHDQGRYKEAIPRAKRVLATAQKIFGSNHPETVTPLTNLAQLYSNTGAYNKAEPLYQRALAIQEEVYWPDHPKTAVILSDLAALYNAKGAYDESEPLSQRALGIWEKVVGPNHPDVARALNGLGQLYYHMGAYDKAEPLYQRALTIEENVNHPNTASSLTNLAELYTNTGVYAKAEPLFLRAVVILEKALGTDHPETVRALHGLAQLHYDMGAYDKAEPLFQRTLAIRKKTSGLEHRDTAWSLADLAALYHAKGSYDKAEPLYQRALAIEEKALGPNHPHTAAALHNLAVLRWVMGQATAAFPLHARSQAIEAKNLERFLVHGSESRNQAYIQQLRGDTFLSVSLSLALPEQRATTLGFTSVLQTKGRVLDAMLDSRGRLRHSMKPVHRALLDELTAVAQQLSNLTHQGTGNLQSEVSRRRREELSLRQEQLETELAKQSAEYREEVAPVSLAAVQTAVPKYAALVEWYRYQPFDPKTKDRLSRWGQPCYVAYVLKHDGEATVVDVGDAATIEQLIHDFQAALNNPATTFVKDVAKELSDKLLKPLLPFLRDTERLLISPDSALNLIPFGVLLDETGAYLATTRDITYLMSGRDLLRIAPPSVAKNDAVVVADPDFGPANSWVAPAEVSSQPIRSIDLDRGGKPFTPLPGTAEEAAALRDLLKMREENVLTQGQATEARLKQFHGPHILHIATHGFFLKDNELPPVTLNLGSFSERAVGPIGENPLLRSGLALAGANQRRSGEKDDGILTATEVAQMDLRGTQLVVLSACETGVSDVQNGEGVYGLRRALVLAGAETQVTSLWKVDDRATKDFMVAYYQRLLKGEGRSEALRNAQLSMMKSKDRSHPYYWAAFVPIGHRLPSATNR